nr:MAG TPA: hypothetical protein [Bacteriophage sp.]
MKEDLKIIVLGTLGATGIYCWIYFMFSLSSVH